MWLNLMSFANSDQASTRIKAASLLACASSKDKFDDLFVELLNVLESISPVLIPNNVDIPSPRSIATISEEMGQK
jgi:hypothetical protein